MASACLKIQWNFWDKWHHWFLLVKNLASVMITFRQGIRDAKISAWACSYHLSQTPTLRAGFSFGVTELSLCTKSCSPTIPAYSQAHFLSPVVNDMYVPPVYACLAVLCIIIYEAVGVLTGNLTAIIMPGRPWWQTSSFQGAGSLCWEVKITSQWKMKLKDSWQQNMSSPMLNRNRVFVRIYWKKRELQKTLIKVT